MSFPWARHYDPGVPLEIVPPDATVPQLLLQTAQRIPQAPAVNFLGRTLSYGEFQRQTALVAQALAHQGLTKGERLAMLLPNCPQLMLSYYAALHLGAVVVLLNPLLSPNEIAFQLTDSGARRLIVLDHLLPKIEALEKKISLSHLIVTSLADYLPWPLSWLYSLKARWQKLPVGFRPASNRWRWQDLLTGPPWCDPVQAASDDLALLQYTGGTTGTPKAAMLTHRNLLANVAQINAWLPRIRYGQERVVALLPFFHVFGLTACLNWPFSQGAMDIVLPRFEIKSFCKALKRYRPTVLPGVPTLFVALNNYPPLAQIDLSSLWACISGSAPLPVEVRDRFEQLTGCRILEGYGLTESSPVTHLNPLQGERPPGSIGLPFPSTQARIVDQESGTRDLPVGEVGELIVKGPQVMRGYWQKPEETALALRNGWLYTGDLARMDDKGFFYIIDRKKDMIIDGGFKIYPREIEEVLYRHPQVKEAVALGVPDAYRGEVVKVVIVPQEGAQLSAADIQAHLEPLLAAYKLPKIIEFRQELPKSAVGKILRRLLREETLAASQKPQPNGTDMTV